MNLPDEPEAAEDRKDHPPTKALPFHTTSRRTGIHAQTSNRQRIGPLEALC